jgi:CDP-diglyceride synthetase
MGRLFADPYVTLMPAIAAGVLNMVWVKLPVAGLLARPIDGGRMWRDSRPILGANKTFKGLLGMVALGGVCSLLWGWLCAGSPHLEGPMRVYQHLGNTWPVSLGYGIALGAAYALSELPNSFLKRRLGVAAGGSATGGRKWALGALDQCDSVIGMVLVAWWPASLAWWEAIWWTCLGGVTHLAINAVLYAVHLRRSPT